MNNDPNTVPNQNDQQFQQLVGYIHQELQRGVESGHLDQTLLSAGWDPAIVSRAMEQLGITVIHPPAPLPPQPAAPAQYDTQPQQTAQALQVEQPVQQLPQYPQQTAPAEHYNELPPADHETNPQNLPQKYRVWPAIFETLKAAKHNAACFAAALGISMAAIIASAYASFLLAVSVVLTAFSFGEGGTGSASSAITLIIGIYIASFIVSAVVGAIMLNTTALALYAGAEGHKTPVGRTLAHAFKAIPRVIAAIILTGLVIIGPLLVSTLLSFGIAVSGRDSGLTGLSILLSIAGAVWAIVAMFRFTLTPYVALFEPHVPILKTLHRSQHLLLKGGQWFVFKGYLLLVLMTVILMLASGASSVEEFENSGSVLAGILSLLLLVIANGVLALLYRNRRAIRG